MTTPSTPAGWYPDPEQAGHLRYWDGAAWTEHRSPLPDAPAPEVQTPAEPATAVGPGPQSEQNPPAEAAHVGSHRAPEPEPEPMGVTEAPTTEVPLREWSFEPPPLEPESTPESTSTLEQTSGHQETSESAPTPQPLSPTELPTTKVPLRDWTDESTPEPAPYADATTPTPAEPPVVEPPAGTEPPATVDNRRLIVGFGGAVAALLILLVLAAVYAFVIHKPPTTQLSSPGGETSTSTTTVTSTAPEATAAAPAAPPSAAGAVDGPLTFTVTGVDSGTSITAPDNEFLTKDAQGEFIVVHLTVQNTSADPGQFLGTFQKLKAAGQVYNIDDEATFYVGGGFVDIPPGGQVDVGLAYDVPPGTVPETVELHADPTSPGVEVPLG